MEVLSVGRNNPIVLHVDQLKTKSFTSNCNILIVFMYVLLNKDAKNVFISQTKVYIGRLRECDRQG